MLSKRLQTSKHSAVIIMPPTHQDCKKLSSVPFLFFNLTAGPSCFGFASLPKIFLLEYRLARILYGLPDSMSR